MKKIIALILVVVLSFGVCSISFASGIEDDNNDYSWELSQIEGAPKIERWKYTSDTSQGCLVDGGQYIGNASVTGNKGVTKIIIFMYPQKNLVMVGQILQHSKIHSQHRKTATRFTSDGRNIFYFFYCLLDG